MSKIEKEAIKDIISVKNPELLKTLEEQEHQQEESEKPLQTISFEDLDKHKTTSEDEKELDDDEYYRKFKEEMAKKVYLYY